ncbi:MAG: hypothetical protein ABR973_06220 [Candidatus Acidiferrales bacterium]
MPNYPVMFKIREVINGEGYLAGVTLTGRGLFVKEDDDNWWLYGVRPGAIADFGTTPQEAFGKLQERYRNLLFDIAEEASTFEKFKSEVEKFYEQPNAEEEERWSEALHAIRSGQAEIKAPFDSIEKARPDNWPTGISIVPLHQVKRFTAADNVPSTLAAAA